MQDSLQEILDHKKRKMETESLQWRKKRDEWIISIGNLFKLIHGWLKPLEDNDYLKISYADISISEEYLGNYSVKKMIITFFNNEKIELIPIGLYIVGAKGRIDMKIGMRKIMIVRNTEDSGWIFSEREGRGKPEIWEFNEDNFKAVLTEFAEEF